MKTVAFITVLVAFAAIPFLHILFTGDFAGAANTYGLQEDSEIVDFVFTVREFFTK